MPEVLLTWHEAAMASEIGRLRHLVSVKRGLIDKHGFDGDGWSEHIEGACGELAVAKLLGVFWDGSVNTFELPDLPGLQVRTRSQPYYDLLVRPGDTGRFVLVTGKCPRYTVRGWIDAEDAKRDEWKKTYGGRPGAYFVPQSELKQMADLPRENADKITR